MPTAFVKGTTLISELINYDRILESIEFQLRETNFESRDRRSVDLQIAGIRRRVIVMYSKTNRRLRDGYQLNSW